MKSNRIFCYKRYMGKIILEEAQFQAKIELTTPVLPEQDMGKFRRG